MQTYKGLVEDEQGFEIEVWVDHGPEREINHVFLIYGGSQIGDFPFSQPDSDDWVQAAANRVAAGLSKREIVDPNAVIDPFDAEDITWR